LYHGGTSFQERPRAAPAVVRLRARTV